MKNNFPFFHDQKLSEDINKKTNLEIMKYAGMYILKTMDPEAPENIHHVYEVPLERDDEILEPVLDDLLYRSLVEIDSKNTCYKITGKGMDYIQQLINETESLLEKYAEMEPRTRLAIMRRDGINLLRARFLWGWYDGEFDDLVEFQHIQEWEGDIQTIWQIFIVSKEFYDALFEEINIFEEIDEGEIQRIKQDALAKRQAYLQEKK